MAQGDVADLISRGRTDLVFELLRTPAGRQQLPGLLTWFVYYNDLTALRAVLDAGLELSGLDLGRELGNAAFFGHWKIADFLLARGADVHWAEPDTGETSLHSAICKAGRPHYANVVKLLLDKGANRELRDANGDTPLSWAGWHLRPGTILALLAYGPHTISAKHIATSPGDHGQGWGGMEARTLGEYLPLNR